ncbi:snaclec convulxin subunit beta-like [Gigantopelta aegis]|uniref:snaclec convulxin subunit beta-like n=1 Tax=Gigantopelta aegis TaxID=1735272 RepID=UPI001B88E00D|nr:snaclec convulxin subunit beta-like [Gigantopelta aegis]
MVCFPVLISELYAISVTVANGSTLTTANNQVGCTISCYRSRFCSSFFFNSKTGFCHLNRRWIRNLTSASSDVNYFVVYPGICQLDGYQFIKRTGMCVNLSSDEKTWFQAKAACESDGGSLIKLDTEDKVRDILDILESDYPQLWFYIGANDPSNTLAWEWTDGQRVERMWWGPGQDEGANEPCVITGSKLNDWKDVKCNEQHRYICEH